MYWLQIEVNWFFNIPKKDRLFIRWNSNTVYDRSNFDKIWKIIWKGKKTMLAAQKNGYHVSNFYKHFIERENIKQFILCIYFIPTKMHELR